jgi:hypothetical protein
MFITNEFLSVNRDRPRRGERKLNAKTEVSGGVRAILIASGRQMFAIRRQMTDPHRAMFALREVAIAIAAGTIARREKSSRLGLVQLAAADFET